MIAEGHHTLIHAPTGSGKTLAAFFWAIDSLMSMPEPSRQERCRILYVSPLKALAYDIDRNLRAPLLGVRHAADRLGEADPRALEVLLRTGDTPPEERRRMLRRPPDILITTPESLYLMLTSQARSVLASVTTVIVDEIHSVAGTKRGAHLAISLERLEEITDGAPQRIGLSATQRPLDRIARLLGGGEPTADDWLPRPVEIVDASAERLLDVEIVVPVEDMSEPALPDPLDPQETRTRSIWPSVYPRILDLIRAHSSTIVFANSRRLAERLCAELNALAGEEIAKAHHGSVSREQRLVIEESLKTGRLPAVVATSTLELGIDMGAVDLVIQVEAPISVASGLQRAGRAGHQVGAVSRAKVFPKYRGDLLLSAVIVDSMLAGRVEETRIPSNPLDVLAQQLVASVVTADRSADELFGLVRRAAPYSTLSRSVFEATLDMLAGRYPSDLFSELRPRVTWDRVDGTVTARPGSRQLAVTNAGTIPDRGLYRVSLPDGTKVGELDEEMVYESRQGDVFILGASTWRISEIGPDRVEVTPAPGEPAARMPFWHGDTVGRSLETGRAVGAFIREIGASAEPAALLQAEYRLDHLAALNLAAYLEEEKKATGVLPSDHTIVVQRFRDEIGDWRVVLLSPLGARVHAPWAMAVTQRLGDRFDADVIWSDDGIAFRFPDSDDIPAASELVPEPEEIESLLVERLAGTAMFAARFREAAGRSLLLPRRRPGNRTPLWLQRRKAADLLGVAKRFGSFPIVLETYREILQDDFDVPGLQEVLSGIRERRIRVAEVDVQSPSPFASSLLFAFVAAFLYEGDAPLAERRATALSLDRELLAELLGEGELRELLDEDALAALELELQGLSRKISGADAIHDLLRRIGPLSRDELEARFEGPELDVELTALVDARRIVEVRISSRAVWSAIEDIGRLRDALGVQPPQGVPSVFLEPVEDPLGDVVGRHARTRGPFTAGDAARSLGLPVAALQDTLKRLEGEGRVVRGAFRPGGSEQEWIDTEVLRRLKRRSLAALRKEIEPVDHAALGRFLPAWQGVDDRPAGASAIDAIRLLQGVAIPASCLERDVLASRIGDPARAVDRLMIDGDLIWVGDGALGTTDGKISLYLRSQLGLLRPTTHAEVPDGPHHTAIMGHLEHRGASFFADLYEACGGGDPAESLEALWDLVWAGFVTNDTLAPVRALGRGKTRVRRGRPSLASGFPAHASGRWSLVPSVVENDTRRAASLAEQLLERHGVVVRNTVASENVAGGFPALYPVFAGLEEIGRIRRGYFVEGLGGSQFALPSAVDRIRRPDPTGVVVLAATDPANPYGAALDWPSVDGSRIGRFARGYVVLVDGSLAAFVDGSRMRVFDPDTDLRHPIAGALAEIGRRNRRYQVTQVDGEPVSATPWRAALLDNGFTIGHRGMRFG